MPNRRTSLKKIRKLLNSIVNGVRGSRRLSEYSGISHTKVAKLVKVFEESDYSLQELLGLDNAALDSVIHPKDTKPVKRQLFLPVGNINFRCAKLSFTLLIG